MSETLEFLLKRRSVLAVMLENPGPTPEQIDQILTVGSRVPDHGKLVPWRFILFESDARARIGETIAKAFKAQKPNATDDQVETERKTFLRAPLVIAVISTAAPHAKIPEWEQTLTAGAVCQNILHAANALGFSAQWLTQWIAYDKDVTRVIGVADNEQVAGFVYIGSSGVTPNDRPRPEIADITQRWTGPDE